LGKPLVGKVDGQGCAGHPRVLLGDEIDGIVRRGVVEDIGGRPVKRL